MLAPPLEAGAVKARLIDALPAVAIRAVGAPGAVTVVPPPDPPPLAPPVEPPPPQPASTAAKAATPKLCLIIVILSVCLPAPSSTLTMEQLCT
jgi:hypothetical protein